MENQGSISVIQLWTIIFLNLFFIPPNFLCAATNTAGNVFIPPNFLKTCQENSDRGLQADIGLKTFCSLYVFPRRREEEPCHVLPTASTYMENSQISFEDRLSKGIKDIEAQCTDFPFRHEKEKRAIFLVGDDISATKSVATILTRNVSNLYATKTGSGDFIVINKDESVPIKNSVMPELLISTNTGELYWIFPGFNKNLGADKNIAKAYFTNYVWEATERAKFLFVIDHSCVRSDNGTGEIDKVVTNFVQLLRNITSYKQSIGLVVNKVTGNFSENETLQNTVQFLEGYVDSLEKNLLDMQNSEDIGKVEEKILFVKSILGEQSSNNSYKDIRISFVRSIPKCKHLLNDFEVINSKSKVTEMHKNQLEYTPLLKLDATLTLKAETIAHIKTVHIPQVTQKMMSLAIKKAAEVKEHVQSKSHEFIDSEQSLEFLNITVSNLNNIFRHWEIQTTNLSCDSLSELMHQLQQNISSPSNCTNEFRIRDLERQLCFFERITNPRKTALGRDSVLAIFGFISQLQKLQEFYRFYAESERELNGYDAQVKLEKIGLKNTEDAINTNNVLTFLHLKNITFVPDNIFKIWSSIEHMHQHRFATFVQESIPSLKFQCKISYIDKEKYHLVVTGKNVRLNLDNYRSHVPSECRNTTFLKQFSVVAMERLFIDIDLRMQGQKIQVSLIAPIVVVIGAKREIVLDGVQPPDKPKARSGSFPGAKGRKGEDGEVGGDSGKFFGVFGKVIHGDKLVISANGGQGGTGQEGGDGVEGRQGTAAEEDSVRRKIVDSWDWSVTTYTERGKTNARAGGNGGRGGNGGLPGKSGEIDIICLSKLDSKITRVAEFSGGLGGLGGKGGIGGKRGISVKCTATGEGDIRRPMPPDALAELLPCVEIQEREHVGRNGSNGKNGLRYEDNVDSSESSEEDYIPRQNRTFIEKFARPWSIVNIYKTEFFGQKSLIRSTFLDQLNNSTAVQTKMNLVSFAQEIETLEKQYSAKDGTARNLKEQIYRLHYQNFLQRLENFTKHQNQDDITEMNKTVANLIYGAVLGKLGGITRAGHKLNVIKTKDYFDTIVRQLDNVKSAQKEIAIQKESSKFRAKMEEKVSEANKFIRGTVQPAIAKAYASISLAKEKIIEEVHEFLIASEDDLEHKKKVKDDFEKMMPWMVFVDVLSVFGTACSFLGPVGTAVGGAITTGSSIAKKFMPETGKTGAFELPSSFTDSMDSANTEYYKKKIATAERMAAIVAKAAGDVGDNSLEEVAGKAEETKVKAASLKAALTEGSGAVDAMIKSNELDASVSDLKEAITTKDEVDAGDAPDNDKKPAVGKDEEEDKVKLLEKKQNKNAKFIKHLALGVKTIEAVGDLVENVVHNSEKLEELGEMVQKAEENVKAVKGKMNQFYDELLPVVKSMKAQVSRETSSLPDESRVALSVKNWKVKGMLKNMRGYLNQFSKGLKVNEKLALAFDTLDEAMTLLIDLYDHIERYEEKKTLADFSANVNSANDVYSSIEDQELREILTNLRFHVKANLFLEDYQKAIHAFKQWVFPFASHYLSADKRFAENNNTVLTDISQVVTMYREQVDDLRSELEKYAATTVTGDEYSIVSVFTSDTDSIEPFYVWTNKQWQGSIKRLLAGQKIYLKADVDMVGQESEEFFERKSAIKYRVAELALKVHNASEQVELDKKLNNFQMKMTHSCVSLYRVQNQHFVMYDRNQTYRYSFEKTGNGHVSRNGVKYKVDGTGSDFLMSPYSWWTFELTKAKQGGAGFLDLKEYEEKVDLELEGEGVYLDEEHTTAEVMNGLRLSDFYEVYDPDREHNLNFGQDTCLVA